MSDNRFQFSQAQTPPSRPASNFKTPLILFLIALIGSAVFFLVTFRVQRVSGTEVGIKVNNVTGDISVIAESGTNIYNGLLNSFHLLDMTVQRLEMVHNPIAVVMSVTTPLAKTVDGSDVFLDLTINYQLRRDMVEAVVLTSGLGDVYKFKWVRDYSRSICRSVFGEMTTEEFYDASVRNTKAQNAMEELNSASSPTGLKLAVSSLKSLVSIKSTRNAFAPRSWLTKKLKNKFGPILSPKSNSFAKWKPPRKKRS